ncbi:MAG: hypothetical protein ABSH15_13380 [Verrucomicrobiota bacterium]
MSRLVAPFCSEWRFAPLPVAVSRGVKPGGTVAMVGFPDIGDGRQSFLKKELRPAGANEDIAWRHGLPPNRHEHFFPKDKFHRRRAAAGAFADAS